MLVALDTHAELAGLARQIERAGSLRFRLVALGLSLSADDIAQRRNMRDLVVGQRATLDQLIRGDAVHGVPACGTPETCRRLRAHRTRWDEVFVPWFTAPPTPDVWRPEVVEELERLDATAHLMATEAESRLESSIKKAIATALMGILIIMLVGVGVWDVFHRIRKLETAARRAPYEHSVRELAGDSDEVATLAGALANALDELRERNDARQHVRIAAHLARLPTIDAGIQELGREVADLVPHEQLLLFPPSLATEAHDGWLLVGDEARRISLDDTQTLPIDPERLDDGELLSQLFGAERCRHGLVVPLHAGEAHGLLALGREAPEFTKRELDAVIGIAPVISSAAERMRLQERVRVTEQIATFGGVSRMLAHELRNPLNSLALHAQLVKRRIPRMDLAAKEAEKLRGHLDVLTSEVSRLDELVRTHLSTGAGGPMNLELIDLGELIQEIERVHRPAAEEQGVALSTACADNLTLLIDRAKILQMLHNLVRNALEALAGRSDSELTLSLARVEAGAQIRIRDNGPGMKDPAAAFRPGVTSKRWGTGMGLPLSQQIARRHGGRLVANALEGGGLELVLTLPERTSLTPPDPS